MAYWICTKSISVVWSDIQLFHCNLLISVAYRCIGVNTGGNDCCGSRGRAGQGRAWLGNTGSLDGVEGKQCLVGGTGSLSIPFCCSNPTSSSKLFYCITKGFRKTPNICFTASYEGNLCSNIASLIQSMFLLVHFRSGQQQILFFLLV